MASTGTLAIAAGSTAAAVTFAVVTIVGSSPPRSDLGEPVFVETDVTPSPGPAEDPSEPGPPVPPPEGEDGEPN